MAPKGSRESGGFFAPSGAQCRAGGAEGAHPEDAGGFSRTPCVRHFYDCTAVLLYGYTVTVPPAAYFFLSCQKKVCKKEAQKTRNSAYAQKNESLHSTYYRYTGGQGTPFGRP